MRVAALVLLLCASCAWAQSNSLASESLHKGAWDFGVWAAGGHSVAGGTGDTGVFDAGLRVGKVLTAQHGRGWFRGNLEYAVDVIPVYLFFQPSKKILCISRSSVGAIPQGFPCSSEVAFGGSINPFIVKWNFTSAKGFAPYFELGGGVLFTNTDVPSGTSNINFIPQAALGTHIFTRPKRSITLDLKYVHISNAGLSVPNPGINTIQFGFGYHWLK